MTVRTLLALAFFLCGVAEGFAQSQVDRDAHDAAALSQTFAVLDRPSEALGPSSGRSSCLSRWNSSVPARRWQRGRRLRPGA
jgi:hypothetical protein